jgi:ribonucleoside-diphosphate reductase alpha chain
MNDTHDPPALKGRIEALTREVEELKAAAAKAKSAPNRVRLADTRAAITHKFSISGHEGYVTVGLYPDGRPGEMFLTMAKEGSTLRGLVDTIAVLTSLALQYGVPVDVLARKFERTTFEPSGQTANPDIKVASSITDYVFRWLGLQFSPVYRQEYEARSAKR